MSYQQALLILLATLAIVAKAQRPLNTTNTSNLLTEPFFIKPTSTSNRNAIPEMRAAGGSKPERPPYPTDLQYSHGREHLQPPRPAPVEKKLHKVDPARWRKIEQNNKNSRGGFNEFRAIANDPNHELNQPGRNINYTHGVAVLYPKLNEPKPPNRYELDKHTNLDDFPPQPPPIPDSPLNNLKNQLFNKTYMHTPSPPSNMEDYDIDEKLGVKCTFEKPCSWTYDEVDGSNFFVTTGANLTSANITGGHFYHFVVGKGLVVLYIWKIFIFIFFRNFKVYRKVGFNG